MPFPLTLPMRIFTSKLSQFKKVSLFSLHKENIPVMSLAIPPGPSSLRVLQNCEGSGQHCRRMGMRLHSYLEDWLQPSQSQVMSMFHRD